MYKTLKVANLNLLNAHLDSIAVLPAEHIVYGVLEKVVINFTEPIGKWAAKEALTHSGVIDSKEGADQYIRQLMAESYKGIEFRQYSELDTSLTIWAGGYEEEVIDDADSDDYPNAILESDAVVFNVRFAGQTDDAPLKDALDFFAEVDNRSQEILLARFLEVEHSNDNIEIRFPKY